MVLAGGTGAWSVWTVVSSAFTLHFALAGSGVGSAGRRAALTGAEGVGVVAGGAIGAAAEPALPQRLLGLATPSLLPPLVGASWLVALLHVPKVVWFFSGSI